MLKIVEMLLDLRAKRQSRNGYILTTHRIINIAIWRKDTFLSICCPSALLCCFPTQVLSISIYHIISYHTHTQTLSHYLSLCCFPTQEETVVRSLFPKKVESGIMKRFRRDLQGLILTDAGAIALNFDLTASTMAADVMNAESRISKRLAFLRAMCSVVSRTKVLDTSPVVDVPESQDSLEQKVLPKVDGEKILARYAGKIYEDSCTDTCPNLCTTRSTWHPACCLKATCGVKPSFAKTAVIVSNMSVYALKADENDPCCKAGMCHALFKNNNWAIYWTHLSGLAGAEVASVLQGTETFWTRCCLGNWCGNNCCPMLKSRVQASLVIQNQTNPGAVTVQARDLNNFKSMRDTPEIVAFRQNLAQVRREGGREEGDGREGRGGKGGGFFCARVGQRSEGMGCRARRVRDLFVTPGALCRSRGSFISRTPWSEKQNLSAHICVQMCVYIHTRTHKIFFKETQSICLCVCPCVCAW